MQYLWQMFEKGGYMTGRLETVEDFERIAKALQDPSAKLHEYTVKSFGYCLNCESVVEYEADYGPEWFRQTCLNLNCKKTASAAIGSFRRFILTGDMVPVAVAEQIGHLYSRKMQKTFLLECAKARMQKLADAATEYERKHKEASQQAMALAELCDRVRRS